jgi:COP9 signalosome complex subunit 5
MGLLQGVVDGRTMVVLDVFALPVEGTETRVNAQAEAYEYMVQYSLLCQAAGRRENVIGWYHSHPGYGCWLSGIDVATQKLNQEHQEPFLAIVVDPKRTLAAGKVDIGAFRTLPVGHKPSDAQKQAGGEYLSVPLEKTDDFGAHSQKYYALDVSFFKSSLDAKLLDVLWDKYWVETLAASRLREDGRYASQAVFDLSAKIDKVGGALGPSGGRIGRGGLVHDRPGAGSKSDKLQKLALDSSKVALEQAHAMVAQAVKGALFNGDLGAAAPGSGAGPSPMDC